MNSRGELPIAASTFEKKVAFFGLSIAMVWNLCGRADSFTLILFGTARASTSNLKTEFDLDGLRTTNLRLWRFDLES
jgi:hypothetical protein